MTVEFIALISLTLSYDEKIEYDNRKKKNDIEGNNRLYFALQPHKRHHSSSI